MDRDRDQTLLQNYKRLGLTSRLGAATGGLEKKISHIEPNDPKPGDELPREHVDALAIPSSRKATLIIPTEVRVERDPETGRILRVIRPEGVDGEGDVRRKRRRRLDDPLNSDSESENETATTSVVQVTSRQPPSGVVAALEAQAEEEAAQLARKKRPRQQSTREREWIADLVKKYGDNTAAMARDRRLNPMQQTEADISRRVRLWRGGKGNVPIAAVE